MQPVEISSEISRLKDEIEQIMLGEILPLIETRKVLKELREKINFDSSIDISDLAHALTYGYVASMVVAVGRMIDEDSRVLSLINLIKDVLCYADHFTSEEVPVKGFLRSFTYAGGGYTIERQKSEFQTGTNGVKEVGVGYAPNKDLRNFFFSKNGFLDMERVRRDATELRSYTDLIRKYRNNVVAHSSKESKLKKFPNFDDLDKAIDKIRDLADSYYLLITRNKLDLSLNHLSNDWHRLLKENKTD
ncbi:MAG: hypothetical protein U0487_00885 [Patescibacteria group bacterium]